jgi:hypothetical protein
MLQVIAVLVQRQLYAKVMPWFKAYLIKSAIQNSLKQGKAKP